MNLVEEIECLLETLEKLAVDKVKESEKNEKNEWARGYYSGKADSFEQSAKWLREILERRK